jgi:FAD/FMN-containing dehydrogenase
MGTAASRARRWEPARPCSAVDRGSRPGGTVIRVTGGGGAFAGATGLIASKSLPTTDTKGAEEVTGRLPRARLHSWRDAMTATTPLDATALATLRQQVRGAVITPDDPAYDAARRIWNGFFDDRRPALIVRCTGVADVQAALRFAGERDLPLAVRGGGHSVAGYSTCDGGIVLDLGPLNFVRVDPAARIALAGGGATWGAFDHETQVFGLATTGGVVSTTGIAGLTLGGGIGWLMRQHGLTCDNLLAVDLVTASGEVRHVTAESDPDLFWALRGGGGNFGVVTTFTYRLHPVGPLIYGGALFYEARHAAAVLAGFLNWTATLPDTCAAVFVVLTAPPEPFIPEPLRGQPGVGIALCFTGSAEEGAALVRPLRTELAPVAADLVGPLPYTALQQMFDAMAPRGLRNYWKATYLRALPAEAQAALLRQGEQLAGLFPLSAIHMQYLGGAVARVPAEATAFGGRDASYVVQALGTWADPAQDAQHRAWVQATVAALQPYALGGAYLNFLSEAEPALVERTFGPQTYRRLAAVKARLDPQNRFRLNANIPPAAA